MLGIGLAKSGMKITGEWREMKCEPRYFREHNRSGVDHCHRCKTSELQHFALCQDDLLLFGCSMLIVCGLCIVIMFSLQLLLGTCVLSIEGVWKEIALGFHGAYDSSV